MNSAFSVSFPLLIESHKAALFISRGEGIHPVRTEDSHELLLVMGGHLSMFVEESNYELGPGDTLFIPEGIRHGGTAPYPADLQSYWIHFKILHGDIESYDLRKTLTIPYSTHLSRPERLVELYRRLLSDRASGVLDPFQANLLVTLMLFEVSRGEYLPPDDSSGVILAQQAKQYIVLNACEPISTRDIAKAVKANPDYLGRIFHSTYGYTITEAIHHHRLGGARKLLMNSALSIAEISRKCGYSDTSHFRRMFKRERGMSASAFRKLYARMQVNTE